MKRTATLLLSGLVALAAAPAHAEEPGGSAQPPAALSGEAPAADTSEAAWVQKLEESTDRVLAARARLAKLEAAYSRGMTNRRLVGDSRVQVVTAIAEAKKEIADAEQAHPLLVEEAREAGVPWGVLQDYETLPAGPPAPDPQDVDEAAVTVDPDSLDAVDDGSTDSLDEADTGSTESLDEADTGSTVPPGGMRSYKTKSLDDF